MNIGKYFQLNICYQSSAGISLTVIADAIILRFFQMNRFYHSQIFQVSTNINWFPGNEQFINRPSKDQLLCSSAAWPSIIISDFKWGSLMAATHQRDWICRRYAFCWSAAGPPYLPSAAAPPPHPASFVPRVSLPLSVPWRPATACAGARGGLAAKCTPKSSGRSAGAADPTRIAGGSPTRGIVVCCVLENSPGPSTRAKTMPPSTRDGGALIFPVHESW